jgi:uncharacterized protein (TIGR02246 family)
MTAALNATDRAAIDAVATALETAWNNGDGDAFAAPFTEDADFVNIRAEFHHGRAAIAGGHLGIFRSIYAGSRNQYSVRSARLLQTDVAVAHVDALLDVPAGSLAGQHRALFSMVLVRDGSGWKIASFHNTLQPPPGR